jgi:hypothetical protein
MVGETRPAPRLVIRQDEGCSEWTDVMSAVRDPTTETWTVHHGDTQTSDISGVVLAVFGGPWRIFIRPVAPDSPVEQYDCHRAFQYPGPLVRFHTVDEPSRQVVTRQGTLLHARFEGDEPPE